MSDSYRSPARGFKRITADLGATPEVDVYNLALLSMRVDPAMWMRDLLIDCLKKREAKNALAVALDWLSVVLETADNEDTARFYVGKFRQWALDAGEE